MEPETETITVEPVDVELLGLVYRSVKGPCEIGYYGTPHEAFLEAIDHNCSRRPELSYQR